MRGQVLTMSRRNNVDQEHSSQRGAWVRWGVLLFVKLGFGLWEMFGG